MGLMLLFQNDGTGTDDAANYKVRVSVNGREIAALRVEGHNRADEWQTLVRKLLEQSARARRGDE